MQEEPKNSVMPAKPKRNMTGIIIAAVCVVLMIALMIVWRQYEARHEGELKASLLTSDTSKLSTAPAVTDTQTTAKPKRVIPDDPQQLLVLAEKALTDEGYFSPEDSAKGFHVYFLLKKCLDCSGSAEKVEVLSRQLVERSEQGFGPWHVDSGDLADLNERIEKAKSM